MGADQIGVAFGAPPCPAVEAAVGFPIPSIRIKTLLLFAEHKRLTAIETDSGVRIGGRRRFGNVACC